MGLRWSKSTKASGSTESPLGRMMEPARKFISRKQEETIDADAAQVGDHHIIVKLCIFILNSNYLLKSQYLIDVGFDADVGRRIRAAVHCRQRILRKGHAGSKEENWENLRHEGTFSFLILRFFLKSF